MLIPVLLTIRPRFGIGPSRLAGGEVRWPAVRDPGAGKQASPGRNIGPFPS
jgi:hypothetical protein